MTNENDDLPLDDPAQNEDDEPQAEEPNWLEQESPVQLTLSTIANEIAKLKAGLSANGIAFVKQEAIAKVVNDVNYLADQAEDKPLPWVHQVS